MKKQFCQSCGMPMSKDEEFGTNEDGTLNNEYCSYCFKNGAYIDADITMNEMLKMGLKGIDENTEMSKLMKFMIKKMYPFQIKKLKRWKCTCTNECASGYNPSCTCTSSECHCTESNK